MEPGSGDLAIDLAPAVTGGSRQRRSARRTASTESSVVKSTFSLLVFLAALTALAPAARADFEGLEFEVVATNQYLDGRYCGVVRVYGKLSQPDQQLVVAYGNTGQALELHTTDPLGFYQNPFGADLATQVSPAALLLDPLCAYDSWVTVGLDVGQSGTLMTVGVDWTGFNSGGSVVSDNGAWFTLPDEPNALPVNGRVLIAQLSCAMGTVLHGRLNFQGRQPDPSDPSGHITWDASFVDFSVPVSTTGTDTFSISLAAGGTQEIRLAAGAAHASEPYLVLSTGSGIVPGFPLGGFLLPLNVDSVTLFGLEHVNQPPFASTMGLLGPQGTASAWLTIPAGSPPGLAGVSLHHTWFAWGPGGLTDVTIVGDPTLLQLSP